MNNPQTWGQWNVLAQNHGTLRDDPVKPDLIPAKKKRAKTVRPRVDMICVWCGEPSKQRMCESCRKESRKRADQIADGRAAKRQGGSKGR